MQESRQMVHPALTKTFLQAAATAAMHCQPRRFSEVGTLHASKALVMAVALLYNTDRLSITIAALRGVLSSHTIQIQIHNSVQKFALRVCLFKIMELKL